MKAKYLLIEEDLIKFAKEFLRKNYDNWGSSTDAEIRLAIDAFCQLLIEKFIHKKKVKL